MLGINRNRLVVVLIIVILISVLSASCTQEEAEPEEDLTPAPAEETNGKEGGTITIAISEEPDTLDGHRSGAAVVNTALSLIGEPFLYQDPDTMDYVPGFAQDWEVSEDGLTWT